LDANPLQPGAQDIVPERRRWESGKPESNAAQQRPEGQGRVGSCFTLLYKWPVLLVCGPDYCTFTVTVAFVRPYWLVA